jgi:protein-S-isoprenylcysteine O-methyltransferase Ste14
MSNVPALILGIILVAYWVRVVALVLKIRRSGQSANYTPREHLGRRIRLVWNPVVGIWIAHPWFNGLMGLLAPGAKLPWLLSPLAGSTGRSWVALAVALGAFTATLVCWKRMGKSWRMGINPQEKTQLISSGPYAHIRHPIYALSSLLMLASMVIVSSPLLLAAGGVHLVLLQWEAIREEKHMLSQHGPAYAEYCRKTGRFLPRLW